MSPRVDGLVREVRHYDNLTIVTGVGSISQLMTGAVEAALKTIIESSSIDLLLIVGRERQS